LRYPDTGPRGRISATASIPVFVPASMFTDVTMADPARCCRRYKGNSLVVSGQLGDDPEGEAMHIPDLIEVVGAREG